VNFISNDAERFLHKGLYHATSQVVRNVDRGRGYAHSKRSIPM